MLKNIQNNSKRLFDVNLRNFSFCQIINIFKKEQLLSVLFIIRNNTTVYRSTHLNYTRIPLTEFVVNCVEELI